MSAATLDAIHEAIRAHVEDTHSEPGIVTDWIVGYCTTSAPDWAEGEYAFRYNYATPNGTTPHGSIGLAAITHQNIADDVTGEPDDDD